MSDITYGWAPITKTEQQDDGTVIVYGPAASSALDRDQQRLNADWLDRAMPAWAAESGNVREQHDPKRAVGVAVGLSKSDSGSHDLAARIVDPVAITKVKNRVLKGFSVGIKNPQVNFGKSDSPKGEIVGGEIIEVSIVDRPSNPETLFVVAKADGGGSLEAVADPELVEKTDRMAGLGLTEEMLARVPGPVRVALEQLAEAGAEITGSQVVQQKFENDGDSPTPLAVAVRVNVTTDGPVLPQIASKADLRKAIRVAGDEPDEDLLGHILNRADALQLADMIPASWPLEVPDVEKAKYSASDRRDMAKSGEAMRDGSYPIRDGEDLDNAIDAVGRGGGSHDAIRAHIVKRANALGLSEKIPDNWSTGGSVSEKATQLAEQVRALVPDLAKADGGAETHPGSDHEAADITDATAAIGAVAKLIISEAESLAAGNLGEASDIACLLEAISALKWFICLEQSEPKEESLMLAETAETAPQEPDTTKTEAPATQPPAEPVDKADGPQAPTQTPTEPATAGEVVTKNEVTDLVKAAIAEATTADKERIAALEAANEALKADVAKALEMPELGGPVLTRTTAQQATARDVDATLLRRQAAELRTKGDNATDAVLREGYWSRAKDLLAKADA
jgi:hypothetical protein